MVNQPQEINNVIRVEFDAPNLTYIAFLNITQNGETFDAHHVFRNVKSSAWAPWLLQEINAENIEVLPYTAPPISKHQVNAERDRRKYQDISFNVNGETHVFQADEKSQRHMSETSVWALKSNETFPDDFRWILANNSLVYLSASQVNDLWTAVSKRNTQLQLKARILKNMDVIPENYKDDSHWI